MRIIALIAAAVCLASCVHIFRPGEIKRRKSCAKVLPVLRGEPERDYRIIRMWEKGPDHEHSLVYEACAAHADAVIITPDETRLALRGVAIKYR